MFVCQGKSWRRLLSPGAVPVGAFALDAAARQAWPHLPVPCDSLTLFTDLVCQGKPDDTKDATAEQMGGSPAREWKVRGDDGRGGCSALLSSPA